MSEPVHRQIDRWPATDILLLLLAVALATGGATLWVSLQVSETERPVVAIFGAALSVALCVAVAFAWRRGIEARLARERARLADNDYAALADRLLPAAARRLRDGAAPDTVLAELPQPPGQVHQRILLAFTAEVGLGERRRAATMAACASAAARVQAMATSMLADLRDMEGRHSEEVLEDLLRLDHSTAQAGRLADSIAVLTGARSGRRWTKPIVMESILRGAMGRIGAFQRMRVHSACTAAIAGYAAEDVMHALAELMDNATRFSAPSEEVHVYVEELHTGVVVTIEDGGLGMKPQSLERAEAAVSMNEPLDITKLSGTRLGLAVVGALARKHGLHVFFRPSSRGGTGVVVRIPNQLIVQPRWDSFPTAPQQAALEPAAVGARTGAATAPSGAALAGPPAATAATAVVEDGQKPALPKRPRGHTLAAATRAVDVEVDTAADTEAGPPQPLRPRPDMGARFSAFHKGGRADKPEADSDSTPGPATSEDESR